LTFYKKFGKVYVLRVRKEKVKNLKKERNNMLVAQYSIGDNVNVDGREAVITRVDTESWVTGGVQPYYWVRLECDGSRELHAEEDINSGESLPVLYFNS
tara:strand:+ start:94818 stop:95114 length:297 start_codon:yes stop_codon:yes gene_type:complete